jgi:uncharacterized membrane protein YjgN (DUF898 family)
MFLQSGLKIETDFPMHRAIRDVVLTAVLAALTFGVALFVFPYFSQKEVMNRSFIVNDEGERRGRFTCDIGLRDVWRHAIVWALLSLVTFGLAYLFFQYRASTLVYNHTRIDWIEAEE